MLKLYGENDRLVGWIKWILRIKIILSTNPFLGHNIDYNHQKEYLYPL